MYVILLENNPLYWRRESSVKAKISYFPSVPYTSALYYRLESVVVVVVVVAVVVVVFFKAQ